MDLDIERVKTAAGHKSKAIIATLGLGVSAFAGALILMILLQIQITFQKVLINLRIVHRK